MKYCIEIVCVEVTNKYDVPIMLFYIIMKHKIVVFSKKKKKC